MLELLLPSIRATLCLAFLTGILFPVSITLIANLIFPEQAKGSLIRDHNGVVIGSSLLGQNFTQAKYFHPRPSAAGNAYCGEASSGSNLGPASARLIEGSKDDPKTPDKDESFDGIKQLAEKYRKENMLSDSQKIPIDAITRSASGLDPDISSYNAELQAKRIAEARGMEIHLVQGLIRKNTQARQFAVLGEPRVNVLLLNLELDKETKQSAIVRAQAQPQP